MIETDIQHLPLEPLYARQVARWQKVNGYRVAGQFSGLKKEYQTLQNSCVLFDRSHTGILRITGDTAKDFLHRMTSAAVNDLQQGEGMKTVITTSEGRFVDWVTLFLFGENDLLMLTAAGSQDKIIEHFRGYIFFKDDVRFDKVGGAWILLQATGPDAFAMCEAVFGVQVGTGSSVYPLFPVSRDDLNGNVAPVEDISQKNVLLLFPAEQADRLWTQIQTAPMDLTMAGWDTYEYARIAAGVPVFPNEVNEKHISPEAHIFKSVDLDGCFAGQEVIARTLNYDKVKQHLCHIQFDSGDGRIEPPADVYQGEQRIGELTSYSETPDGSHAVGLAYIRSRYLEEDMEISIRYEGAEINGHLISQTKAR